MTPNVKSAILAGNMMADDVVIRPWCDTDSHEELTDLLHRAYKVLADMGLRFLATHQDVDTTRRRVKAGECFVAELRGRIVGTVTFYRAGAHSGCPYYTRPEVCHIGQMAVEPSFQKQGIANLLMHHVEEHARHKGFVEIALDTAEPAHHLIDWYTRRGYRQVDFQQWDVTNYRSVIMAKGLREER